MSFTIIFFSVLLGLSWMICFQALTSVFWGRLCSPMACRLPGTTDKDRVRLAALYALRFESDPLRVRQVLDFLTTAGVKDR